MNKKIEIVAMLIVAGGINDAGILCAAFGRGQAVEFMNCKALLAGKSDLGEHFGGGLYQAEIDYFKKYEFVLSVEDLLWRRTKLALFLSGKELQKGEKYFKSSVV